MKNAREQALRNGIKLFNENCFENISNLQSYDFVQNVRKKIFSEYFNHDREQPPFTTPFEIELKIYVNSSETKQLKFREYFSSSKKEITTIIINSIADRILDYIIKQSWRTCPIRRGFLPALVESSKAERDVKPGNKGMKVVSRALSYIHIYT